MGLLAACALALRALSACGEIHGTETLPAADPSGGTPTELAQSTPGTGDLGGAGAGAAAPDSSTDNGQTGSLSPDEQCHVDAECVPRVESWTHPDFEYQLLDSSCEYAAVHGLAPDPAPSCVCKMAVTGPFQDIDAFEIPHPYVRRMEERVFVLGEGDRQYSRRGETRCLLEGERPPYQCNYWDFEFPGCDIDSGDNACNVICEDAVQRLRTQTQTPHEIEVRLAECRKVAEYPVQACTTAVRIDDQCYNSAWTSVSCALSDEEIANSPYVAPAPAQPALLACSRAEDCPAGLGCDGSQCGPCLGPDEFWYTRDAQGNDVAHDSSEFRCGDAEVCSYGTCLLAQRAECRSDDECGAYDHPGRHCRNTGVDNIAVRGNEQTESHCTSDGTNVWGLEAGDVLQATPLGPSTEVDAQFQPALYVYPGVGCAEVAKEPLTFYVAPAESAFDAPTELEAPGVAPPPPPNPPRALPEGRQLHSAHANYQQMFQQRSGPYELRGCSGQARFVLDILSEGREQARARAADGSFPTTVLEFNFDANDPTDPSCGGLEARWCTEHVELKRLTP